MDVKDPRELRRRRRAERLSQRELAEWVRCSHTTIHLLESAKMRSCSPDLAEKIERILKADPGSIFVERLAEAVAPVSHDTCGAGQVA